MGGGGVSPVLLMCDLIIEKNGELVGIEESDRCHFGKLESIVIQFKGLNLAYFEFGKTSKICLQSELIYLGK